MILSACIGTNADLIKNAFELYVKKGSTVADVTFGKGVFWQKINKEAFKLLATDLQTGVDFRTLPYDDKSIDVLLLDPPYMHGGATVKQSIKKCYKNSGNGSHFDIVRLYAAGILEAARVLKKKGIIMVKCQDEIESAKQRWSHEEIGQLLDLFGFLRKDLMILMQKTEPARRFDYQNTARKNHSYLLIGELR